MNQRILGVSFIGVAILTLCACASRSGDDDTRMEQTRRGIGNAVSTPLRDVGLIRPDIPDVLETLNYPYSTLTLAGGCPNVLYEIGQLDAVLGDEEYQPGPGQTLGSRASDAASDAAVDGAGDLVGDVVPYRGWVRRLSGANRAERRYAHAIEMGQMRRAFLRGYGASLGCRSVVPAPPPPSPPRRRDRDEEARQQQQPKPNDVGTPP